MAAAPSVYQNAKNQLVRVECDPKPPRKALVDNGAPRIAIVPQASMYEMLPKVAEWRRWNERRNEWVSAVPGADLRSAIYQRGYFPGVKQLRGIVCRPILLPNGEILGTSGYHADTGLILDIDCEYPTVMSNQAAVALLLEILIDFPFDDDGYKSAWIAALLTLLCRNLIEGNTPFFPVDGNRSRCGKGLLTDLLILIHQGRRASRYTMSDGDEMRKLLTSIALSGQDYLLFDNIKGRFGGVTLEAAMTAGSITDRLLGRNQEVTLPLDIVWLATCNGMTYTKDMLGRTYPIVLNTSEPHPETRTGFGHPNLLEHVKQHRRELLIAGLSIVANYIRAGQPLPQNFVPLGGFVEWSNLIRGAVIHAGLPDPDDTRPEFVAVADDAAESVTKQLLDAWRFREPITVKEVLKHVVEYPAEHMALATLIENRPEKLSETEYLSKRLRDAKGVIVNGRCFDREPGRLAKWYICSQTT